MNLFDELDSILFETPMYKMTEAITEWYDKNKKNPLLYTSEGTDLRKHLNEMMLNHALVYGDLARIHLGIYNAWQKAHPNEKITEP